MFCNTRYCREGVLILGVKKRYIWNSGKSQFEEELYMENDFDYSEYFKQKKLLEDKFKFHQLLVEYLINMFYKFAIKISLFIVILLFVFLLKLII